MVGNCPQCGRVREPNYRFCPQCGFPIEQVDEVSSDPLLGRVLGGAYVLLEKIGAGGMGAVYRAEQRTLGRTVAVKVIHDHLLHDASLSERFFNEAHAASRLSHPNVVSVIDFGKTDSGVPYLVMEYLRGHDLRTVMRDAGLMETHRVEAMMLQILEALGEAHALGIIHRDLKPANVVLEPTRSGGDFVKVVDFGLAKILHGSSARALTSGGLVRGTPTYMAPEQAKGDAIDARTDVYALGVTFFELLTGSAPFKSKSATDLMLKHVHAPVPDPRSVAPTRAISEAVAKVVMRALAKEPEDRFQTADDFARELRGCGSSMSDACAYPTIPVPGRAAGCPTCGEPLTSSQKFCGACGFRISSGPPSDGVVGASTSPPSHVRMGRRSTHFKMRVEGTEDQQAWLHDIRLRHEGGATGARLVGTHGSGKTTILRDFAAMSRGCGDAVVLVGPDPWWAAPAYHALRRTILQLVRLPAEGRDPLGWAGAGPEAVAGLEDVFFGVSEAVNPTPEGYRRAAAAALCWAIERARQGAMTGRVVIVVDDLERVDGLSRNAMADALQRESDVPWLLVAGHVPHFDPSWPGEVPERVVQGIPCFSARQMLAAVDASEEALDGVEWVSPLLVEQRVRAKLEGHERIPGGLADLVAQRMAALPPSARSVLDVMAVLGNDVVVNDLASLVDGMCNPDEGLLSLAVGGFIEQGEDGLRWVNPLFREVARGATPAAFRTLLFSRAAELFDDRPIPMEVQAWLALESGRGLEALFLLERIAETCRLRGYEEGAIEALRRGYHLARKASRHDGLEESEHAVVVFGRKLAAALLVAGRLSEAKTAMQDVIEHANTQDAVEVLTELADVPGAVVHASEAQDFVREAICRARHSGKPEVATSLERLGRKWAS